MNKYFIILVFSILCVNVSAQIYVANSSVISFFSEAPLENIQAVNKAAKPMLNTSNNEIAIKVPIKGFVFEKPLMQEHFNENYMESDKYPHAIFKGKINETIDYTKDGTYKASATGKLDIHGVEKDRTIEGTITVKGQEITLETKFDVKVADHKITIPKVVFQNIAEIIEVKMNSVLVPFKKK